MDELDIRSVVARIKARHGLKSMPELARLLGVTEKTVSNWMHGRNWPDDRLSAKLAGLAGIDPDALTAYHQGMRATTPEARETWLRIARRLLSSAIFAVPDAIASLAIFPHGR